MVVQPHIFNLPKIHFKISFALHSHHKTTTPAIVTEGAAVATAAVPAARVQFQLGACGAVSTSDRYNTAQRLWDQNFPGTQKWRLRNIAAALMGLGLWPAERGHTITASTSTVGPPGEAEAIFFDRTKKTIQRSESGGTGSSVSQSSSGSSSISK
jgi:hypothetical protein